MKKKVCHIITRLIQGGAQENTVATVELLNLSKEYEASLITGPAIGPEGTLIPQARSNIRNVEVINELRRQINPFYDLIAFIKLAVLLKKGRYDIVHTHSSKAGIIGRIAAKIAGVKCIIHTIHGLPFHGYQNRPLNKFYVLLERFVSGFTDKIIVVAGILADKAAAEHVAPRDKFETIYSGMDLGSFYDTDNDIGALRKSLGFNEDDVVIGKVARLFHLKGHDYVIDAVKEIAAEYPNIKILFVGGGILEERLNALVREAALDKCVYFTGLVNASEVPKFIGCMDIVVHTSLREGLPRVIPQAYACGKPVIAFDIDGACEVVEDGVSGYLVPPGDMKTLKGSIVKLAGDRELRIRMGEAGKKRVDPVFSNEYMVKRIEELYNEILR
ncbi:glycosyltransferase family 4 protein [Candidatus Auribacterota bacterium]